MRPSLDSITSKDAAPHYQSARDVRAALQVLTDNTTAKPKDRASCGRFVALLDLLFADGALDDVELLFARDWTLDGAPFRTTWTAGWFLATLQS